MRITHFRPEHLEAAAELATASFTSERKHIATLPRRHEDKSGLLPLLERLAGKAPAVAALDDDGNLLGFLIGMNLPSFKGTQRGVYCPEWAHAAAGGAPGLIGAGLDLTRLAPVQEDLESYFMRLTGGGS